MIGRFFSALEEVPMDLKNWFLAFLGITFVRTFLENFSSKTHESIITSDFPTLVHYISFYLVTILAVSSIVFYFTKKSILVISKVALFGLMCTWIPPVVDFVLSKGTGSQIAYLFAPLTGLVKNFFLFFGAHELPGVTVGIRIELVIVLLVVCLYVWQSTRSVLRSLCATISVYVIIFILLAAPSFVALGSSQIWIYFVALTHHSFLEQNFFHPTIAFTSPTRTVEMYFNGVMSQLIFLATVVLTVHFAYIWNWQKTKAIIANSRPERVLHYMLMILLGMFLAYERGGDFVVIEGWLNSTSILILFFSFYCAWMFAVGTNDLVDLASDRISNRTRPLVTGLLLDSDARASNYIFITFAFWGAYISGHYVLFMVTTFTALYYVYSVPPLHLKRFALLNSFIISLVALTAVLAGFYMISPDPRIDAFPSGLVALIVLVYTLLANVKDIKDVEGDRAVGVYTIPVLLGIKRGKQAISFMVVLALALIPLFTGFPELWYTFVPFSMGAYLLINRTPFIEKHLFYLYFSYAIASVLAVIVF